MSRSSRARTTASTSSGDTEPLREAATGRVWRPHDFQKKACRFVVSRPEALLFLDPGLGKSSVTLAALKAMMRVGAVKKALVVAPLRVCYGVWTHAGDGELSKWSDFSGFREVLLHGDDKEERLDDDGDLYVVNFDGLRWLAEKPEGRGRKSPLDRLIENGIDTLVVDEISKLKDTKTKRFRALKPYLKKFRRRYGLTGSPAANGLMGLFGETYVVDHGRSLGQFITHYRFKYFVPTGFGGYKWRIRDSRAEKEIYGAMKDVALAMRAADHLKGMPTMVENNLWVDLPKKARRIYEDLEEEMFALVDGGVVTAASAAVAMVKCRQVASGGLYVDDGKARRAARIHDEKTDALEDLVDELQGRPLLVGYEFQHDLERILERVPHAEVLGSRTKLEDVAELVGRWNAGEVPVLCGHPQSMGHGLNLQGACDQVAWYSTTWDFELYDQLIRRVMRQGNKSKKIVVHRIAARKTVDEVVLAAIASKRRGQNALFDALKKYRAGGR